MSHQNQRFVEKQYTYSTPTPNISKSQLGKSTPSFVAGTAPIPWVNYRCGLHHIESWIGSERARFRPGKKQWSVTSIHGAFSNNAYMNLSTYVICDIYIYIYMLYVIYILYDIYIYIYICVCVCYMWYIYIYICYMWYVCIYMLYAICMYICVCYMWYIYIYIYTYMLYVVYVYIYMRCMGYIYIYICYMWYLLCTSINITHIWYGSYIYTVTTFKYTDF